MKTGERKGREKTCIIFFIIREEASFLQISISKVQTIQMSELSNEKRKPKVTKVQKEA